MIQVPRCKERQEVGTFVHYSEEGSIGADVSIP